MEDAVEKKDDAPKGAFIESLKRCNEKGKIIKCANLQSFIKGISDRLEIPNVFYSVDSGPELLQ